MANIKLKHVSKGKKERLKERKIEKKPIKISTILQFYNIQETKSKGNFKASMESAKFIRGCAAQSSVKFVNPFLGVALAWLVNLCQSHGYSPTNGATVWTCPRPAHN